MLARLAAARQAGSWERAGLEGEKLVLFVVRRTTLVVRVGFFFKNVIKEVREALYSIVVKITVWASLLELEVRIRDVTRALQMQTCLLEP